MVNSRTRACNDMALFQGADNAFDKVFHSQQFTIGGTLARGDLHFALLIHNGTGEQIIVASNDRLFLGRHLFLNSHGDHGTKRCDVDNPLFHADPHAGNVFWTSDQEIAILDWTLVGRLSNKARERVTKVVLGALTLDGVYIQRALEEMSLVPTDQGPRPVRLGERRRFGSPVGKVWSARAALGPPEHGDGQTG